MLEKHVTDYNNSSRNRFRRSSGGRNARVCVHCVSTDDDPKASALHRFVIAVTGRAIGTVCTPCFRMGRFSTVYLTVLFIGQ